jgi:formylglycine-generating enzyme required for sulfatase activity
MSRYFVCVNSQHITSIKKGCFIKNKIKLFGIALAAIIGFSFAACDDGGDSGNNPTPIAIRMVWIQGGTFTMGSPETEPGRYLDETQHQVTLGGFFIGKYPVTQGQYQAVMGSNPSYFKSPNDTGTVNHPVERVSWYDAIVFCNKLSMKEGLSPAYRISGSTNPAAWGSIPESSDATWDAVEIVEGSTGYRLPTEAQWEYACRADTTMAFNNDNNDYTNAAQIDAVAWYIDNSSYGTCEVGFKTPNAWDLYDMHGNVSEWCWDWYGSYSSEAQTDPTGVVSGNSRVRRGGAWGDSGQDVRSACRSVYFISFVKNIYIGFRLVRP